MENNYLKHLIDRGMNFLFVNHRYFIDAEKEIVTFLLYSEDGRIIGTQSYNRHGSKTERHDLSKSKYVTHSSEQACWGWEALINFEEGSNTVLVTESIFKSLALYNLGFKTISILGSTWSKKNKNFFKNHPKYRFIFIGDNDSSGLKAGKYFKHSFQSPIDLDEMRRDELIYFLREIDQKVGILHGK